MKSRKLIAAALSISVLFFFTVPAGAVGESAETEARGEFFLKNILINGEQIVNYNLQYPFFVYENTTYFPLTPDMGEICGFRAEMDWDSGTLVLRETAPTLTNIRANWYKNNAEDTLTIVGQDIRVLAQDGGGGLSGGAIGAIQLEEVDLGGAPVLLQGEVIFLPLRAVANTAVFDWDIFFEPYFGICLSTKAGVPARSFWPEAVSSRNSGLAAYIQSKNSGLDAGVAQDMVFLVHRASDVYAVDEKLLIAMAEKESHFRADARSASGAMGLMQVMPATAAGYGISAQELLDLKISIDFGAMYISNHLNNYGGNVVTALSAYNQGSGAVSRGAYSRTYAEKILNALGAMDVYMRDGGYEK
jgi:hypothetical protein